MTSSKIESPESPYTFIFKLQARIAELLAENERLVNNQITLNIRDCAFEGWNADGSSVILTANNQIVGLNMVGWKCYGPKLPEKKQP